jgi:hypothetical protein
LRALENCCTCKSSFEWVWIRMEKHISIASPNRLVADDMYVIS